MENKSWKTARSFQQVLHVRLNTVIFPQRLSMGHINAQNSNDYFYIQLGLLCYSSVCVDNERVKFPNQLLGSHLSTGTSPKSEIHSS